MNFIEKLKHRWGVKSAADVLIILLVFTCTGFTSLYIKNPIFEAIGIPEINPKFLRGVFYTLAILIFYNILLLVYGLFLGSFVFSLLLKNDFLGEYLIYLEKNRNE